MSRDLLQIHLETCWWQAFQEIAFMQSQHRYLMAKATLVLFSEHMFFLLWIFFPFILGINARFWHCFKLEGWVKYLVKLAQCAHPRTVELSILEKAYLRLWHSDESSSENSEDNDLIDVWYFLGGRVLILTTSTRCGDLGAHFLKKFGAGGEGPKSQNSIGGSGDSGTFFGSCCIHVFSMITWYLRTLFERMLWVRPWIIWVPFNGSPLIIFMDFFPFHPIPQSPLPSRLPAPTVWEPTKSSLA